MQIPYRNVFYRFCGRFTGKVVGMLSYLSQDSFTMRLSNSTALYVQVLTTDGYSFICLKSHYLERL